VYNVLYFFSFYLCVFPCNVDVVGQFQTFNESMCNFIKNILHNLT